MSTATNALAALRDVFGYPAFRGAQAEIIDHVSRGGDARSEECRVGKECLP